MRTTRFILPLVALVLCVMPAAAMASDSGSTQAIVNDVAKDGKVDGHYTSAELKAAAASPLLKQYGGQGAVEAVVTKPTTTSKPKTAPSPLRRPRPRPRLRRPRLGRAATCRSRAPTCSCSSP